MVAERVVQAVGIILLIGVLFIGVLGYMQFTGMVDVVDAIKAGVDKLVGWFIPSNYSVELVAATPTGNYSVTVNGYKLTANGAFAAGSNPVGSVHIVTDKQAAVVIKVETDITNATIKVSISKTNAEVIKDVEQIGTGSYLLKLEIYPIPETNTTNYVADVYVNIDIDVPSDTSGTVTVYVAEAHQI